MKIVMRKKVYIESTIPSYLTGRPSRDIIVASHQQLTEEWWVDRRHSFDLFISQFVFDEIIMGDKEAASKRCALLENIPELLITDSVQELAASLVASHAIPKKAARDAAHISVAAVHSIDYLLTWNCVHIANAEVIPLVQSVCASHGFECPRICTPEELMGVV